MLRRYLSLAALLLALALPTAAQAPFQTFAQFTDSLAVLGAIPNETTRDAAVDAFWADLVAAEQIPFALGDSAAFLWQGSANTVRTAGDHNGWNPNAGPLARVGLSDVWMQVYQFPEAARLDYKLVVDGSWILDPNNPHQQWSGFGPNSELRMPAWVFPEETVRVPGVPEGDVSPNRSLASTHLGYTVRYRVYTPAAYNPEQLADLPTIYVTDGHEYADDRLGAFRIVLDNLIADGRAAPAIVVFVDPNVNGQNLRQQQYVQNPDFAAFLAEELVPTIDAAYRTRPERDARVILGTSLGGLFSAYLGLEHPETFGRLAIQSPAFWVTEAGALGWEGPPIYDLIAATDATFDVYMSTGTINDTENGARQMRDVFEAGDHALVYREVPEGHSWGNWRALLDEVLLALLPGIATDAEDEATGALPDLRLTPYPNPATDRIDFRIDLPEAAEARVACFDLRGRRSVAVGGGILAAGTHILTLDADALGAAGTYLCRLHAGDASTTTPVTLVR